MNDEVSLVTPLQIYRQSYTAETSFTRHKSNNKNITIKLKLIGQGAYENLKISSFF